MSRYISNAEILHRRLQEAKKRSGMTAAEIAEAADISIQAVYWNIGSARRQQWPSVPTLCALCEALDLSVEDVLRADEHLAEEDV